MKIKTILASLLLTVGGQGCLLVATAQDSIPIGADVKSNAVAFVQGVSLEKNLTLSIAPSYAPDLINKDGVKDQWGACIALTYHPSGAVGQYTFTGLRLDYLGGEFWAPSITGGLKADVQLFGVNVTPVVYTGAVVPLSGAGSANGDWGVIAGGGVKSTVWNGLLFGKEARLSVFAAAEKWSQFDGMIYHVGPSLSIKW